MFFQSELLRQIGFERHEHPLLPLFITTCFTMIFMLALRKFSEEVLQSKESMNDSNVSKSSVVNSVKTWMHETFVTYWIFIVVLTIFLIVLLHSKMTAFRIFYMILFLAFILTFIISFKIWRRFLYTFLFLVVTCAMVNLFLIYTYQFKYVVNFWTNTLGVSEEL